MSDHFREECQHGLVYRQCRCPSADKKITIVSCDLMPQDHENYVKGWLKHQEAINMLVDFLGTLPVPHPDRAGILRSIEVLRTA